MNDTVLLGMLGGAYVLLAALTWTLISRVGTRLEQLSDRIGAQGKEMERGLTSVRLEIAGLREELHLDMADPNAHREAVR